MKNKTLSKIVSVMLAGVLAATVSACGSTASTDSSADASADSSTSTDASASTDAQELDSTGGVLAKVAATPGSIGYISLDALDDTVNGVSLNDAEPTEENILAGTYALQRPFVMATKGEISEQNDLVKTWFDYVNSDEGKEIIKGAGLIVPQS